MSDTRLSSNYDPDGKHDPLNAISEANATGRVAEIFAEVREVLQIPLVTSIWRSLASVDDGLETAWRAARPIFLTGEPEQARKAWLQNGLFPTPDVLPPEALSAAGLKPQDQPPIMAILDAYNRSNQLNLLALTALVRIRNVETGRVDSETPSGIVKSLSLRWPVLRPLLEQQDIPSDAWELLERSRFLAAYYPNPAMPTVWRHLIHWPGLIKLILGNYEPLHQDGTLKSMIEHTRQTVEHETGTFSKPSDTTKLAERIPEQALRMITNYIGDQPSVCRMASVGQSVANWLRSSDWKSRGIGTWN